MKKNNSGETKINCNIANRRKMIYEKYNTNNIYTNIN